MGRGRFAALSFYESFHRGESAAGLTRKNKICYTTLVAMQRKKDNVPQEARQKCRGRLVLLGNRNYLGAGDWAWEGISLGGRRGLYGCEMGYKRFSHMSEIKFAHVRLTFCTCANYKSDMCEFLFHGKADPIGPRHQPKKIQGSDQFHPIIKLKRSSQWARNLRRDAIKKCWNMW